MAAALVHCDRVRFAMSLGTLVTPPLRGRQLPRGLPPLASKGSPGRLQGRV